jgi:hypothetical protein
MYCARVWLGINRVVIIEVDKFPCQDGVGCVRSPPAVVDKNYNHFKLNQFSHGPGWGWGCKGVLGPSTGMPYVLVPG